MLTTISTAMATTAERVLLASQIFSSSGFFDSGIRSPSLVPSRAPKVLFPGQQIRPTDPYIVRLSSRFPSGTSRRGGSVPPPAAGSGGGDGNARRARTTGVLNIGDVGNMEIQIASESDAEEILALQKLAYQSEALLYDDYNIPPLTQSLDDLKNQFQNYTTIKVVRGGKIIGSARGIMKGGTCFIGRVMVHPKYQGKGIGTELMHEIERHFPDAERFELFVGARSEGNIRLYRRLGYEIYKTEKQSDKTNISYMEKSNRH